MQQGKTPSAATIQGGAESLGRRWRRTPLHQTPPAEARLPLGARIYVYVVAALAGTLLATWLYLIGGRPVEVNLPVLGELVALAAIAQHFPLMVAPKHKVDVSIAVYFAVLLLAGVPAAVAIVGAAELIGQGTLMLRRDPRTGRRMRGLRGVLFNASQLMVAVALAGLVRVAVPAPIGVAAAGGVLWLANSVLVAAVAALHQSKNAFEVWLLGRRWNAEQGSAMLILGYLVDRTAAHEPWVPLAMSLPAAIIYVSLKRTEGAEVLRHHALHDALTDLPNRTLLYERLERAAVSVHREKTRFGLLVMDLDRFKEVNDTFGHHYGDLLLQQIALRLQRLLRETDTVARLGGDEFAVLLQGADVEVGAIVARKLLHALEQPFLVGGEHLEVRTSIGLALYPDHGTDAATLLRHADVAMYAAKRANRGFAVYAAEQDDHSAGRLTLTRELRAAIERDELVLHYQPQVDFKTGRVIRVEALSRWQHPQRGLLPPDQFIPLAEQTGSMPALTLWALNAALVQCRAWRDAGYEVGVAVNVSAQYGLDVQLPDTIAALLANHGVSPSWLEVEITESDLMTDAARALEVFGRLSAMGVRIAIDDFGTGYSSLTYLQRLPVDVIKIDKTFVLNVAADENDATIVRSTIGLGHDLGLTVVAEGVHDRGTWERLARLGCDVAQGYYVSRPLPAPNLTRWLAESSDRLHPSAGARRWRRP